MPPGRQSQAGGAGLKGLWGGREDHDMNLHPIGCRHSPGRVSICLCKETAATMIVGGLERIDNELKDMERGVDNMGATSATRVDMPGHDMSPQSTVLWCEICGRSSVRSWESYQAMIKVVCDGKPQWPANVQGTHTPMSTPQVGGGGVPGQV